MRNSSWKTTALELHTEGMSWREIAREIGVPRSTVSDYLRVAVKTEANKPKKENAARILIFDTEVSPSVALAFGRFKVGLSPKHILQEPYMLTFSAKWLGEDTMISCALPDYPAFYVDHSDDYALIKELWALVDAADIIVAHNLPFDIGWLAQRCIYHGLPPFRPVKWIDTLRELKRICTLPSNSLEASTKYFEIKRKLDNEGISLWKRCMEGEVEAFRDMQTYNDGDVDSLEELYLKLRPWMMQHPNVSLYTDNKAPACVCCGSTDLQRVEGYTYTQVSAFELYRCGSCSKINRGRQNMKTKEQMKNILTNAQK